MTTRWQISAGEITEWLPPLLFVFAVVASAWVLHDARRHRFALYAVAAWTLATLVYAPVFLPLYLVARMFKTRPAPVEVETPINLSNETLHAETEETGTADTKESGAADAVEQVAIAPVEEVAIARVEQVADDAPQALRASFRLKRYAPLLKRYALSLVYACVLLAAGAVYFYRDYHSFDAYLARAANARLLNRRDVAIREYRAALRLSEDAHTRKLLALQLAEDGQAEAALSEFRAAERGGEPDELLPFRIASALDALGRKAEAENEYRKFLQGSLCARQPPNAHCEGASARLGQTTQGGALAR